MRTAEAIIGGWRTIMSVICKWFGHTLEQYRYGQLYADTIDGIGRHHGFYNWKCERCGEDVHLYVHFPSDVKTEYQWRQSSLMEANNE